MNGPIDGTVNFLALLNVYNWASCQDLIDHLNVSYWRPLVHYHKLPLRNKASWDEIAGIVDTGFGYTIPARVGVC
jgi:hypothetical protein